MYKLLLILKYLRKRRIAWVALLAVTLCTTMVLVVISVMGGWLEMFEHSFQGLTGDVIVESAQDSLTGFPHYQEMISEMLKLPSVEAAVPTIHTFGIINFASPSRPNVYTVGVQVMGLPIDQIGTVNAFPNRSISAQSVSGRGQGRNRPEEKAGMARYGRGGGEAAVV